MVNWGDRRLPQRFWDKVIPEPNSGCWLWIGGHSGKGYGKYGWVRDEYVQLARTRSAHRLAYAVLVGPIPDGLHIDHLCRTPCCVNPAHLEPVTTAENTARGNGGLHHAIKTHCPSGHEYDDANTYVGRTSRGGPARHCRHCKRAVNLRYKARLRSERGATP